MKINYNNQDLEVINRKHGYGCLLCEIYSSQNLIWCSRVCRFGNIWIKDICNSDIFRL